MSLMRLDAKSSQAKVDASEASFDQARESAAPESMAALQQGLELARGFLDGPHLAKALQPHDMKDLGEGIYRFSMGYTFPLGDGSQPTMDTGVLFIDTTPGQDGMSVVAAKRDNGT